MSLPETLPHKDVSELVTTGSTIRDGNCADGTPSVARRSAWQLWPFAVLGLGLLMLVVPTMVAVAQQSWSSEQGAHGPIVLAIALWLLVRAWPDIAKAAKPGALIPGGLVLSIMLFGYFAARIVGSLVLEALAMYGALLATLYLFVGLRAMRQAWFPLAYFLFVLPPPGSFVAIATQPLRLQISAVAVDLLAFLGYPVGRAGLEIFVDQYTLQVKAACGGLNSMISLTAIGLFYAYFRHNANLAYCAVLFVVAICMAIVANFVRVMIVIFLTYYLGEAAAQGFLHDFAGLVMFAVTMGGVLLFDEVAGPLRRRLAPATPAESLS
jgi:exosortase